MKMPHCCTSQKGVEKVRLSLSLKQRRDENTNPTPGSVPLRSNLHDNNKTKKRPFNDTYNNTLEAAKKLKLVNTILTKAPSLTERKTEYELLISSPTPLLSQAMLNGHVAENAPENGQKQFAPVASLTNLGNTCFLNSVLYTLRFAPNFLHNLHHLVGDLSNIEQRLGSVRLKSSSLGRSRAAAGLAGSGARSWSSRDLLALGNEAPAKSKIQVVTERLHETYVNLRALETRSVGSETLPYAADSFLSALREVNSTFEGNRQQDAHELLVCILDNIRETCQILGTRVSCISHVDNGDSNGLSKSEPIETETKAMLGNLRKSWKKKKESKCGGAERSSPTEERETSPAPDLPRSTPGWDFVSDFFEGMTVLRTTCMECETVTERKQAMCDICVPVSEHDGEELEQLQVLARSSECLRDHNKYWCEQCLRYNEARRSIAYETLPRLLVIQLKRFSGGMEKITKHSPTLLELSCFCETCSRVQGSSRPHSYSLWAIIMHLGQALSGGHYMAYVKDSGCDWDSKCSRDDCDTNAGASTIKNMKNKKFMKNLFNRSRPQVSGCTAKECCAPRSQTEATWLVCDDDLVKPVSQDELDDILSPEPKLRTAATPYLLFYAKNENSEVG